MIKLIIKRLLIAIPLIFCVSLFSFFLIQLAPGNYFEAMKTNPQISLETIEKYQAQYHLDEPFYIQFYYWFINILQFDFGYSFVRQAPVTFLVLSFALNTLILALASLMVTWMIAIPLGIYCAVHRNRFIDNFFSIFSYIGVSFPSFLLALLFLFIVAQLGILPIGGMTSLHYDQFAWYEKIWDRVAHMIVPVAAVSLLSIASIQRIMRGNMLETLRSQYILTAKAKGLKENTVVYKHALRNAINPLVTLLGYEFAALLSGTAIIEIICNWPGLGKVMLEAVMTQDLYLVMGGIIISSVMLIFGNLFADVLLHFVDPRIQVN